MKRSKTLMILYHFPPSSGPGVMRAIRFVKYLHRRGEDLTVLTAGMEIFEDPWEYRRDDSLLSKLPPELRIVRTKTWTPVGLRTLLMRLRLFGLAWFFCYPLFWERQAMWLFPAFWRAIRIIREEGISVIYTSSGPFTALFLGRLLRWWTGVPWVADLRDPFSFGYMWRWPSPLHHRAMQRLEGWALRGADRIIVNTPTALATYRRLYSDISGERWRVLPNGFDPDDFPEWSQEKRSSERLTIVYTGSLAGYTPEEIEAARRKGRKGARFLSFQSGTCDPTTRSGYFLLQGVARALEAEPALRRMLRIDLIGKIDPRNERLARSLGIEDVVSFHAPIPHDEALRRAAAADLLFLPLEQGVAGERTPYIPGKAYEYLAMRKPVLLLAGDSDTREILERAGLAFPTPPDDPEAIAARIVELHRTFRQVGTIPVSPDEAYIERFRADRQAETFCAILREAEGGEAVEFPATPVTLEGKK